MFFKFKFHSIPDLSAKLIIISISCGQLKSKNVKIG